MSLATTLDRRRPKSPRGDRVQRATDGPTTATPYAPPKQRLNASYDECVRLDRELKVIENSGHARLGVFAKPLGEQQRCRLMAAATTKDSAHHLPEDPVVEPAFVDDDDVTSDPFFHRFYDDQGRSMYEQLLRARMRVLALAKMVYTRESVAYARAAVELAETYARMNLWKQAHTHGMAAHETLKALDETRASRQNQLDSAAEEADDDSQGDRDFGKLLAFFYDRQLNGEHAGEITKPDLAKEASRWHAGDAEGREFAAIVAPSNLDLLFGAAPFLHWQQLLLRMERQSAVFQDYLRGAESRVASEATRSRLHQAFSQLDPSCFGVVPLHSLIELLEGMAEATPDDGDIARVCEALRSHDARVEYPSLTWSELLQLALQCLRSTSSPGVTDPNDPARDLRPRIKFLLGRFFLRKGQLDDAMRYIQVAIAEHEQVYGPESDTLVPLYLAMAETLSVRFKQLAVVARQHALEIADKWLKTTDGSRRLRSKALEVIDLAAKTHGTSKAALPSKKEAEARAREELLQEYAALSLVRPDATAVEDAVEYCTKAWCIQDATHGADHVSTASVHVALAQVHAIREDWVESVRCYEQAVSIYEAACNGPVPASVWLTMAVAKIHQQHTGRVAEAAAMYDRVGDFFHSFALEFASSDATRRESCGQAIEAWRLWLATATGGRSGAFSATMEDQRRVRAKIHDATVDGYGEFSVEAAESGRELAQLLVQMGQLKQAERHFRAAWYVLESHYGANDRRSRKARKELMELSSEIKGAALDHDDDGDHAWLTI